jgi:integrase
MAIRLTQARVDAARRQLADSGKSVALLWDDIVRGYGARITRHKVALVLNYRAPGDRRERRMKIAELGELTIEGGRRKAAEYKVALRIGSDPWAEFRAQKASAAARLTFRDIADRWLRADHGWSSATLALYTAAVAKVMAFGDKPLDQVTRGEWAALIEDIASKSPSMAGAVRRTLGSLASWAIERELVSSVTLPKRMPKMTPRARVIDDAELVALWRASEQLEPVQRAFARFVFMTALRSGAAAQTRREWVQGGCVTYPGTVSGLKRQAATRDQHHKVFLSPWALSQLERVLTLPTQKLFPYVDPQDVLKELREATDITNIVLHDTRRSFRSWAAKSGITADAAETCLGHQILKDDVAKAYQRHRYETESERAFFAWQQHIRSLIEGETTNVVPLIRSAE